MPYKDREKKLAHMKEWRKEKIAEGYGKWLYARRKLRFDDAERFRLALVAIEDIAGQDPSDPQMAEIFLVAEKALRESRKAEEKVGGFDRES